MAAVPHQPALALQRTKQGAPGSTSAQASTRKRVEAEDRGAQAKRDLAGRRTLLASLGCLASVVISVAFATSFGLAWAGVEGGAVTGCAVVALSIAATCGDPEEVGSAAGAAVGAIVFATIPA